MAEISVKVEAGEVEKLIQRLVAETVAQLDKDRSKTNNTLNCEPVLNYAVLLLKPRDAAKMLAISERTLWQLTSLGQIPRVAIGRAVRYSVADLRAWIEAKTKTGEHQEAKLTGAQVE